jgi:hypothetical protein
MKRYDSVHEFLTTLHPKEEREVKWSIDALLVQYWEVLRQESSEGRDSGGIMVPVGGYYLSISVDLEWKNLKLKATVLQVTLLDNYELVSKHNDNQRNGGGY